jgi:hypothetical protein
LAGKGKAQFSPFLPTSNKIIVWRPKQRWLYFRITFHIVDHALIFKDVK